MLIELKEKCDKKKNGKVIGIRFNSPKEVDLVGWVRAEPYGNGKETRDGELKVAVSRLRAGTAEKNTSNFPNPSRLSARTKILANGEGNKKTRRTQRGRKATTGEKRAGREGGVRDRR